MVSRNFFKAEFEAPEWMNQKKVFGLFLGVDCHFSHDLENQIMSHLKATFYKILRNNLHLKEEIHDLAGGTFASLEDVLAVSPSGTLGDEVDVLAGEILGDEVHVLGASGALGAEISAKIVFFRL